MWLGSAQLNLDPHFDRKDGANMSVHRKTVRMAMAIKPLVLLMVMLSAWGWVCPVQAQQQRLKVGVALSGGGAKGVAHIGVLRVLEDLGVPIDFIAGTSMGSIIGGLYAAGYTPEQLVKLVGHVDWGDAFSSTPRRRSLRYDQKGKTHKYLMEVGLGRGELSLPTSILSDYKLLALLNNLCLPVAAITDFNRLPIPFRSVATDLVTGDKVVLASGSLAEAMRASMSIPTVFAPFVLEGRLLIDGGIVENLPVTTLRDMGADVVIAVDVGSPLRKREDLSNLFAVLDQTTSFQIVASTRRQAKLADLVIRPKVAQVGTMDFAKTNEIYQKGFKAAEEAMAAIRALVQAKGIKLAVVHRKPIVPVTRIKVGKITFDAPKIYRNELFRVVGFKTGQVITAEQLEDALHRIYGQGLFDEVNYTTKQNPDGSLDIHYATSLKYKGEITAAAGLTINTSTERSTRYTLRFQARFPRLLSKLGVGELDAWIGYNRGVRASWSIPTKRYYVMPEIFYTSDFFDVYSGKTIIAEYQVDEVGTAVDTGIYFASFGAASLGYVIKRVRVNPTVGGVDNPSSVNTLAGLRFRLGVDNLDRVPYPRSGLSSKMEVQFMDGALGSTRDYVKLRWRTYVAIPINEHHVLLPNVTLTSAFNTDAPLSQAEKVGGFPEFLGYSQEELIGNEVARFQVRYNWEFHKNWVLMFAVNVGGVWDDFSQVQDNYTDLRFGGGVGLGWATPVGPLNVALGLGEGGRYELYFNFGQTF